MFCPKCGHELEQGAKFCDLCGAATEPVETSVDLAPEQTPAVKPPEIYADYPQTFPEPLQHKKKKGIFLKIIAVLLIAVISVSAIAVLGYFTFLPAKYTLMTAEYMTVQKSYKQLDSSLSRLEKLTDAASKNSIKSQSEISFSVDPSVFAMSGLDQQTIDLIQQYLTNITFKTNVNADMKTKKENLSFGLNYQNNPVISINGFLDDKKLGFNIPELSKTSLVGEFKDLKRLEELYPESIAPGQLASLENQDPWISNDIRDEIQIKHTDIKKLMETYTMALVNNLQNSDMSIKRGQTTEVLGKEMSCQEVTITLDQKAQRDLLVSLLDTAKEDDNLYNLLFGNIIKMYDIMIKSNPTLADSLQGADLDTVLSQAQVKVLINQLKKSITADMFPEGMTVKAYIKGFDVVKYELEIPVSDNGENVVLTFENVMVGDSSNKKFTITANVAGDSVNAFVNIDRQYDKSSDTQDMAVEFNMDIGGSATGNLNFKLDSKEDPVGKNTVKKNTNITLAYSSNDVIPGVSKADLTITSDGTETRNNDGLPTGVDSKVDMSINIPDALPQPVKLSVAVKGTTAYGEKVETPDWSTSNIIDLSTATREDLDAYLKELTDTLNSLAALISFAG